MSWAEIKVSAVLCSFQEAEEWGRFQVHLGCWPNSVPYHCKTESLLAGCQLRVKPTLQEPCAIPGSWPTSSSESATVWGGGSLSRLASLLPLLPLHFSLTLCLPLSPLRPRCLYWANQNNSQPLPCFKFSWLATFFPLQSLVCHVILTNSQVLGAPSGTAFGGHHCTSHLVFLNK